MLGVFAIDLSLGQVRRYVADQTEASGSDIWLYTGSGAVISHPELEDGDEVRYLDAAFEASGLESSLEMTSRFTMHEERTFTVPRSDGGPLLIATAPVSGVPWQAAVAIVEKRITARIGMSLLRTTSTSLAVVMVFLRRSRFLSAGA